MERRSARRALCAGLVAALIALAGMPAAAQTPAKQYFGAQKVGSGGPAVPFGSYAKGCLYGGQQLPETGPTWQAMRLSRNRNWGHPEALSFIQRLSRQAAQLPGWNGLYIGDISQPRGGPMLTGHASHQMGLDIDIWLRPADTLRLSRRQREEIGSISMQRQNGAFVNGNWTRQHHALVRAAAQDPAVARIFIFAGGKAQMCADETGDRSYLRKIRPWWGHDTHFHVRLACPRGARGCVDQAPPPAGDGCDEARAWVNGILNPPPADPNAPPPRPKPELTLADLPEQCTPLVRR